MSDVIANILKHEGGYQNNKADAANKNSNGEWVGTNRGITPAVYEKATGQVPTARDMKRISREFAAEIYRKKYVEPVKKNLGVDESHPAFGQLVDMAVNHGYTGMVVMVQRATGATVDGKAGPKTKEALTLAGDSLNNALVDARVNEYNRIAKAKPETETFLPGWLKRAESYRTETNGKSEPKSDPVAAGGLQRPGTIQGRSGRPTNGQDPFVSGELNR
jgi:lysozyme family protein